MNEENTNIKEVQEQPKAKADKVIWVVFAAMCLMSVAVMFSAINKKLLEPRNTSSHIELLFEHIFFLLGAVVAAVVVSYIPTAFYRMKIPKIGSIPLLGLIASFICLILLLIPGFGVEANGATRGLKMFGLGTFQPYEMVKLSIVLVTAYILASRQQHGGADKAFKPIIIIISSAAALVFTENLSTALIIITIPLIMMWIGRISVLKLLKYVGVLAIIGNVALAAGWFIPAATLKDTPFERLTTQANRIKDFVNNDGETATAVDDYQIKHSLIAIANGADALVPQPGSSTQNKVLPLAYMDFIFSILVEEYGIGGAIFVMLLYLILLYRAGVIAYRSEYAFNALLAIGVALIIVLQAFISMAVCVHLGPVTGQPLPLFSWGGTSIIITGACFGILQGLARDNAKE